MKTLPYDKVTPYYCSPKVKSMILHCLFIQLLRERKTIAAIK
jgi:hypothetical protein